MKKILMILLIVISLAAVGLSAYEHALYKERCDAVDALNASIEKTNKTHQKNTDKLTADKDKALEESASLKNSLQQLSAQSEEAIAELNAQIAALNEEVTALTEQAEQNDLVDVSALQAQTETLTAALADKDNEIAELTRQAENLHSAIKIMSTELSDVCDISDKLQALTGDAAEEEALAALIAELSEDAEIIRQNEKLFWKFFGINRAPLAIEETADSLVSEQQIGGETPKFDGIQ